MVGQTASLVDEQSVAWDTLRIRLVRVRDDVRVNDRFKRIALK